ncbi:TlpA family protein disulfide reductase [Paracoccus gahaiensis]|uniref:TlpA family protein disulfide reductase n=1 Tax=Paracoccus gahaiensis TaxID=1706839 RepID=A0A4U0R539_9RHOB|nr:TlpA disulfide reductase family protein [Paracoccus gahaiensis]TJZ89927.1 TlpA family protein disulfide reductase [Paracoccus gahaiensis]
MNAIALGPFVFETGRLAAVLAIILFTMIVRLLARRGPKGADSWAIWAVLGWIIGARIGFVVAHWDDFAAHPLDALAVWQGGFAPRAGWVAGGAVLLVAALRGRRTVLRPLLIAAVLTGSAHQAALSLMPRTTVDLPVMELLAMDDTPMQLAGRNRVVVLNLWATWCPPCRREMPMMTQLATQMPDVDFIFANQGEDAARIAAFLAAETLPAQGMLRDPGSHLMGRLNAVGMPTTLVFDAQGALVRAHTGEISRAALRTLIETAKEP